MLTMIVLICVFCTIVKTEGQTDREIPDDDDDFGNIQILPDNTDQHRQPHQTELLPFGELDGRGDSRDASLAPQLLPFVRPEVNQQIIKNAAAGAKINAQISLSKKLPFIGPLNKKHTSHKKTALIRSFPGIHIQPGYRGFPPYGHHHGYHHHRHPLPVYTLLSHSHHVHHRHRYI